MTAPFYVSRGPRIRVPMPGGGSVPEWTQYTPLWEAGFTPADPGAGSVAGWYRDEVDGNGRHTTDVEITLLLGAGFDIPAGEWTLWLPDIGDSIVPFAHFVGGLMVYQGGMSTCAGTGAVLVKSGTREARLRLAMGDVIDDGNPIAWAANDRLVLTARYGSEFVSCS